MKCYFCGSDNLGVNHTDSKNEFVTVTRIVTKQNEGLMELVHEPIRVSATRRKVHCKDCGRYFYTVEHFESSTKRTDIQERLLSDNIVIGDVATELPKSDLSYEEKERLNKLIQEDLL